MSMTKQETMDYIEELKQELEDRPVKIETVIEVQEVTISNSDMGGDIGKLAEALAKAQGEFKSVVKGSEAHAYNFASFQQVVEASTPTLSKNGLSIIQLTVTKVIGKAVFSGVKTILAHEGGGYVSGEAYIPTMKTKMNTMVQMFGVNSSYLKRYGWLAICGLATTDEDTDGVG